MNNKISIEDKKMLRKMFWRSFTIYSSWNQLRGSGAAFCYAMMPAIERFYKNPEDRKEALKRHAAYFNITSAISTFPMGIAASMEKENSEKEDFDAYSINAVKASLMGPLSGIGDAFFWGTIRVIAAGIGIGLAKQGSVLGPILFLLLFNIPAVIVRYLGTFLGYSVGGKYVQTAYENGTIKIITRAAGILGLMMVGAMVSQTITFTTTFGFTLGDITYKLQDILDQIMIGVLPLGITLGCFGLLRKKVSANKVMIALVVLSFIISFLGLA